MREATQELLDSDYKKTDWNELPTLSTLSLAALNVLNHENDKGFVMMIEGGAIDYANHGQNPSKSVLEHTGFSKAIDSVIQWIEKNSSWDETLLIITADHETGQIWGPQSYNDDNSNDVFDEGDQFNDFNQVVNNGRGKVPGVQYGSKGHTNALVPIWAKGPGASRFNELTRGTDEKAAKMWNFSGKFVDNTDIFNVMKASLSPIAAGVKN